METKKAITPNEDLYGDFTDELIPLPLDAIQQRIDFFGDKVKDTMHGKNQERFYEFHKAWVFWKSIKEQHCIKDN